MAPELPEPEIQRLVQQRIRKGTLSITTSTIPPARRARGGRPCTVCGFTIATGRNECEVSGLWVHERCAVIWREESDRLT